MKKIEIIVQHPGIYSSIQDLGRKGFRHWGIPQSGALDIESMILANSLVENKKDSPTLEMTIRGGQFLFLNDCKIGITGAEMPIKINEKSVDNNRTLNIRANDLLKIGFAKRGCRAYLAIKGLPDIEPAFKSYSTYELAQIGGFQGRSLKKGDRLIWNFENIKQRNKRIPPKFLPRLPEEEISSIKILRGAEWSLLSTRQKNNFLNGIYRVSPQSNRMGFRLLPLSENLNHSIKQLISSATIPGIIQLPQNGNPIILMNDGQTTGGYPRIAKVAEQDLSFLAQVPIGAMIRFQL